MSGQKTQIMEYSSMIDSSYVETNVMFELDRFAEFEMDEMLVNFLKEYQYPWEILNAQLEKLIENCATRTTLLPHKAYSITYQQVFFENMDSIFIEEGAIIEPYSYIAGPTFLSKGSTVRHGAYLRGNCVLWDGAIAGHATECKNALFLNNAKAAHFNYVGDSVLGVDVNLGAGTKLANLKFDSSEVKVRTRDQKFSTGIKKFGTIFGNRAQTGCNAVTNPGSIFLPDTSLLPNKTSLGIVFK